MYDGISKLVLLFVLIRSDEPANNSMDISTGHMVDDFRNIFWILQTFNNSIFTKFLFSFSFQLPY